MEIFVGMLIVVGYCFLQALPICIVGHLFVSAWAYSKELRKREEECGLRKSKKTT